MRLAYSNILRRNYLILEQADRGTPIDEVLRVATMHKADRVSSVRQEIAVSFTDSTGLRSDPELATLAEVERWLER